MYLCLISIRRIFRSSWTKKIGAWYRALIILIKYLLKFIYFIKSKNLLCCILSTFLSQLIGTKNKSGPFYSDQSCKFRIVYVVCAVDHFGLSPYFVGKNLWSTAFYILVRTKNTYILYKEFNNKIGR